MMNRASVTLQRLLGSQAAANMLEAFSPLLRENPAALLDAEGRPLHGAWPADEGMRAVQALLEEPDRKPSGEPFPCAGAYYYPLLAEADLIGLLAARHDSPALRAAQNSLSLLIAQGLEKRELARETLERYREINLIYHIADRIGASLDADEILRISLSEAQRTIRADSGLVMLWEEGDKQPARFISAGKEPVARAAQQKLQQLWANNPHLAFANSLSNFFDTSGSLSSLLYAPILSGGIALGLLCLARETGRADFTAGDQKLLSALASQAGSAVEKARLHKHELERQRVEQELVIGERIQRSLLPRAMPVLQGWDFAASYQSAAQVGGDFYDIFPLQSRLPPEFGGLWAISIADVTGKGIPAALMMAFSQAVLRASAATQSQPADVLAQTNRLILQNGRPGLLLTAFFAVLDTLSGRLRYSNGGHEPPILFCAADRVCRELECGQSTLIGAYPNRVFPDHSIVLAPGDTLLLYTDGITEARSSTGGFFTEERLIEVVQACGGCSSADLLQSIMAALRDFTAGAKQSDDITLFAIKRL